ncbi:MAG: polysulfide reductase NrfD [Rhodocyclales bacterium]|nr:polysulfide reductase NrfD [Rhodocyclales bacterium]
MEREIVSNAFHHVNWGIPIAVYFWLVGSSAGSFVISSLGWVFGIKKFKPISFFASNLAIVQLLIVPALLVFDLGRVMRASHLFPLVTGFWHATASLAWGTALVATYPIGMAIYSYLIYKHNEKWARVFGFIAVIQAISTHWYTGITMALNPSRHPNHTALAALLFLIGAFISGIGLLIVILKIRDYFVKAADKLDPTMIVGLGRLMLLGLCVDIFLVFSEFIHMTYGTEEEFHVLELVSTVFRAPVLELYLGLGLALPLAILVSPYGKRNGGVLLASALIATGIFGMRLGWVLISQFSQTIF